MGLHHAILMIWSSFYTAAAATSCTLHLGINQLCGGRVSHASQLVRNTTTPWTDACCAKTATCRPTNADKTEWACSSHTLLSKPASQLLGIHNQRRLQHRAPKLAWSPDIAQFARQHACRCNFTHDTNRRFGENLYGVWGPRIPNEVVASSGSQAWYKEVKYYNFSNPGWNYAAGHFTQMVWKNTKRMGCGLCWCPANDMTLLTCKYDPPGNVLGQFRQNVLPPTPTPLL
jgi:uncharacterized protein YkwD